MRKTLLVLVPTLLLGACTWGITLDDAGKQVRTAWNGNVSGCHDMGKITVSVLDHVGPVDRNDIKVRDELEVMARNEAAKMGADTIRPLSEPAAGEQPWEAYQCGSRTPTGPAPVAPAPAASTDGAQTFPIKHGG